MTHTRHATHTHTVMTTHTHTHTTSPVRARRSRCSRKHHSTTTLISSRITCKHSVQIRPRLSCRSMFASPANPLSANPSEDVDVLANMLFGKPEESNPNMDSFMDYLKCTVPKLVQYKPVLVDLADEPDDLLEAYGSSDAFSAAVMKVQTLPTMKPAHQRIMWTKLTEWKQARSAVPSVNPMKLKRTPSLSPSSVFGVESSILPGNVVGQPKVVTPPPIAFMLGERPNKLDISYSTLAQRDGSQIFAKNKSSENSEMTGLNSTQQRLVKNISFENSAQRKNIGWCRDFKEHGVCDNEDCIYAHTEDLVEPCWFERAHGACQRHQLGTCLFRHDASIDVSAVEQPEGQRKMSGLSQLAERLDSTKTKKTSWCRNMHERGTCPFTKTCRYGHTEEEIEDCFFEKTHGKCSTHAKGTCLYKHSNPAPRTCRDDLHHCPQPKIVRAKWW